MTKIYLIRHAQAEGNVYRMMQGHWDGGVTRQGRRQIELLEKRFRGEAISAVYSSDLYRARLTASALTRGRRLSLLCDPALREINVGPWETRFFGNLCREEPEEVERFLHDPEHFYKEGAETFADVTARALPALERIARRHVGQTAAVVSHGVTIRCLLSAITGTPLNRTADLPISRNTAVTTLLWENGVFTAQSINDDAHLSALKDAGWGSLAALWDEALDPEAEKTFYNDCYRDSWLSAHGNLDGFWAELYRQAALEHFRADPRSVLRFYRDEEPVGLIDLDPLRGAARGLGWLSLIYLKPEYRGQGYGAQLLARALFHYRALGRRALRLHVAEENAMARAFYEKEGFRLLRAEGGGSGRLLLLEKKLGGPEE